MDIVERLRAASHKTGLSESDCQEAADEIEKLRNEIADIREELGEYRHSPALAEAATRARKSTTPRV